METATTSRWTLGPRIAKHTPGPWTYDPTDPDADIVSTCGLVARTTGHQSLHQDDESRANAHLIAAAPGMAAMLEELLNEDCDVCQSLLETLDTAEVCMSMIGECVEDVVAKLVDIPEVPDEIVADLRALLGIIAKAED
jgi:hypothetical protein